MALELVQKQPMMRKVIYSLIPIYVFSFYLYGLNLLLLTVLVFTAGFFTEFIVERTREKKVSEALFVTCMLYLLSLPAKTPWWIAVIGIVFGVLFGKEVFGGFGKNIFNPAIVGRLFVYISFPNNIKGFADIPGMALNFDSTTAATPLEIIRNGGSIDVLKLLFGWHPSSMGEGCIMLIILAGVYLIFTKTANWYIIVSTLISAIMLSFGLDLLNIPKALPALPSLLSGSFFFVAVFMATDPISAPKKNLSRIFYGIIIGSVTILVRTYSLFPEGTSFGVLIGNTFASLLDEIIPQPKSRAKK